MAPRHSSNKKNTAQMRVWILCTWFYVGPFVMRRPLLTKFCYIFIPSTVINSYKYRNVNCHLTQSRAICKCINTQAVWHCIGRDCVFCRKEVTISEAVALENYSFVIRGIS
uniref:Reprolysin n=1 Tax=Rhipicephalus zambeziensis TaxID=60191 RepID=A0A224YEH9_9ACAR